VAAPQGLLVKVVGGILRVPSWRRQLMRSCETSDALRPNPFWYINYARDGTNADREVEKIEGSRMRSSAACFLCLAALAAECGASNGLPVIDAHSQFDENTPVAQVIENAARAGVTRVPHAAASPRHRFAILP
jgi:hypothetical protein